MPDAAPSAGTEATNDVTERSSSFGATVVAQLRKNVPAMTSLIVLVVVVALAVAAPWVAPREPNRPNLGARLSPPSLEYPFGTDHYGRDVLSRTLYGARVSLTVGIAAVGIGALFGVLLGLVAGYVRGAVDSVVMRVIDVMLAFPLLLLALLLIVVLGSNVLNVIIATGISTIPQFARVVRGSVLSIREREYVHANRALGAAHVRTMLRHVLPNTLAPIIVMATLYTASVIILEANLGFLGFGVQPPQASWGSIVNDGRRYLAQAPWVSIFPSLAIVVTVLALNTFGDGLRDAMDPRLRQ
jgi:peptide/nickel transport system permease protein